MATNTITPHIFSPWYLVAWYLLAWKALPWLPINLTLGNGWRHSLGFHDNRYVNLTRVHCCHGNRWFTGRHFRLTICFFPTSLLLYCISSVTWLIFSNACSHRSLHGGFPNSFLMARKGTRNIIKRRFQWYCASWPFKIVSRHFAGAVNSPLFFIPLVSFCELLSNELRESQV